MSRTGSPWLKLFDVLEVTGGRLWDPMPSGTEPHFSGCAIDSRALEGGRRSNLEAGFPPIGGGGCPVIWWTDSTARRPRPR